MQTKRRTEKRKNQFKKRKWIFAALLVPSIFLGSLFGYIYFNNQSVQKQSKELPVQTKEEPLPQAKSKHRFDTVTKEQAAQKIPILMYHDVQNIPSSTDLNIMPSSQFEAQLIYLKENGYTTITVEEFIDAYNWKINLPQKSVLLTLDDGFQSIKTIVNPLLKKYDMRATSFIIGSYIERPQWHLTGDDIKTVASDKYIDFESHTFDLHKDGKTKGLINETLPADIHGDNTKLEAVIGHKTNILCYPFGAFSQNALDGLQAAHIPFGFAIKSGTSSWVSLNQTHTTQTGEIQNPLALPRVRVNANISISDFATLISEK